MKFSKRYAAAKAGTSILLEWLGEGGTPVPDEQAEERAMTCKHGGKNGAKCPLNWTGDWWTRVTAEVAIAVMEERRTKSQLNLRVSNEHLLGTCEACLCHLPTKVFVDFKHIVAHTPETVWKELPEFCWMKRELQQMQPQQSKS